MAAREWLLATICCLVLYPLSLLVLSGPRLFDRPFWADEVLSWLIASDQDFSHAMAALAGGVDTNAPILHWIFHLAGNMFGHTPLTYRLVSTLAMSLGLLGIYASLRRYADRLPSFGGTFVLLTMPIILAHTTEARFYGLFLAAAVWTCFFIDRRAQQPTVWNAVAVGIASILLCGIHYFGILALGCITVFAMARSLTRGLFRVADIAWPTAAGAAMTLCLLPLLKTQRQALAGAGSTWVPDHFLQNLTTSVSMLLPTGPAMVIGMLIVFALVSVRSGRRAELSIPTASLAGLALLVPVLIAFDRIAQPVLVPRYLIPSLAAIAIVVCGCLSAMPTRLRAASIVGLLALFVTGSINKRIKMANPDPRTGMGILAQVPNDETDIVVDWRGHLLPIWADRPLQRNHIVFLDDRRITHPDLDQSIPFEREMVRIMNRFYGFPRTITVAELARMDRFRLVTEFPETAEDRLGRVKVLERSPMSLLVERQPATAASR
jgi:hypothetical protein